MEVRQTAVGESENWTRISKQQVITASFYIKNLGSVYTMYFLYVDSAWDFGQRKRVSECKCVAVTANSTIRRTLNRNRSRLLRVSNR